MAPHQISELFSLGSQELWTEWERKQSASEASTPEESIPRWVPSSSSVRGLPWLSEAHSRASSIDSVLSPCFKTIQEMDFCKSFLETYCFDTMIFNILPKQISFPFRLFHCEMIPFSNSVLNTMQIHCNSHWLSGKEEEKKLLKMEYKLYLKQFSEKNWLWRLWARTAGSKPSRFPFQV